MSSPLNAVIYSQDLLSTVEHAHATCCDGRGDSCLSLQKKGNTAHKMRTPCISVQVSIPTLSVQTTENTSDSNAKQHWSESSKPHFSPDEKTTRPQAHRLPCPFVRSQRDNTFVIMRNCWIDTLVLGLAQQLNIQFRQPLCRATGVHCQHLWPLPLLHHETTRRTSPSKQGAFGDFSNISIIIPTSPLSECTHVQSRKKKEQLVGLRVKYDVSRLGVSLPVFRLHRLFVNTVINMCTRGVGDVLQSAIAEIPGS